MKFTDIFIQRPVLAGRQPADHHRRAAGHRQFERPPVSRSENAVVTVTTVYTGASAELVRGFITTPLERAIAAADGIDYIQSQSAQGFRPSAPG
jgi:multidrug efflux pump